MKNNVLDCTVTDFRPGLALRATVKAVGKTGVMVEMPDGRGSGVITPRCWGDGMARKKALASIRPGDEFDVIVRLYDARTLTLSLVLADRAAPLPKKAWKSVRKADSPASAMHPRKPEFQPIAQGTVFLWDAANLLGAVGAENAVQTFNAIASAMSEQGYKAMFFIERRCLTWARCNQRTVDDASALDAFARRGDVVVVEDGGKSVAEADSAILQMAEALPGSVCVTCDHYEDYAHVYPNIVGTSRIRSFSVAKACGKTMILVNGITHAIVVENVQGRVGIVPSASDVSVPAPEASSAVPRAIAPIVARAAVPVAETGNSIRSSSGLLRVAGECVRRGDAQGAVRIYEKVAKRDPAAYRALAEMYREGKVVPVDGKKATRYERLARKSEKRRRARNMRERRVRAEAIRSNRHTIAHLAIKRREALDLAIFGERYERAHGHRRLMRTWRRRGGVRSRAA